MADWKLYCEDLLEGAYTLGSLSVDGVNDSSASTTAPEACDLDHATFWDPTGTGTQDFYINLTTARGAKNVAAVGFANAKSMSGLTVTVYSSGSWATAGANQGSFTAPSAETFAYTLATPFASPFWLIRVAGTTSSFKVGDISLLSEDGVVTLTSLSTPAYPIGRPLEGGTVDVETGGGSVIQNVMGGTREGMQLDGLLLKGGSSTDPYDKLRALFHSTRRFSGGLWLTDDSFSSPSAAHRATLAPGSGIQAAVVGPGPLYRVRLDLRTLSNGVDLA